MWGHSRLESRGSGQKGHILPFEHCFVFSLGHSLRNTFCSSSPYLPISLPPSLLLVDPSSGVIYSRNRGSASFVMLFFLATFSQFPLCTDDSQASGVTQAFSHLLSFPSFSLPLSLSLVFGVMDPSSHDSAWHLCCH